MTDKSSSKGKKPSPKREERMLVEVLGDNMKISPADLYQKKFPSQFRGAHREEVRTYLEEIADQFEVLLENNRRLSQQVRKMTDQLSEYQRNQSVIQNAVISAQKFGEKLVEEARETGEKTVEEAQSQADKITREADEHRRRSISELETARARIEEEITNLDQRRNLLKREIRTLLDSMREVLDDHQPEPAPERNVSEPLQ